MSQRKKYWQRCQQCLMRTELCLCADIPQLNSVTKVIVIVHHRELKVPTNTGRLACQALSGSVLLSRGQEGQSYDLQQHLLPERSNLVLYPSEDAQILSPEWARQRGPFNLLVPDGNWRQTSKMCRRDPLMAQMQRVKLPEGAASRYLVRNENKQGGLATLEAIARTLDILEESGLGLELEKLLACMTERIMRSRGLPY